MIDRLSSDQKSRATLLMYFDANWAPAIAGTRLVYDTLNARGVAWRHKLDSLVEPPRADRPAKKPPVNRYLGNTALQGQIAQARRNMDTAVENFSDLATREGNTDADVKLWNKVAAATDKYEAADAQRQAIEDEFAKEYGAWEKRCRDYEPVAAYDTALQIARTQLIAMIEQFNARADFDEIVDSREQFLNHYASFVPTHHFYLSNVQGGTYVYVYEQNRIDVHLHCTTFDGPVTLITFKKWGSSAAYSATRGDSYLGGKKGLTERPSHLSGIDQTYVGLIKHLRTTYPPVNQRTPQNVAPKLPRQRP